MGFSACRFSHAENLMLWTSLFLWVYTAEHNSWNLCLMSSVIHSLFLSFCSQLAHLIVYAVQQVSSTIIDWKWSIKNTDYSHFITKVSFGEYESCSHNRSEFKFWYILINWQLGIYEKPLHGLVYLTNWQLSVQLYSFNSL